MPVKPDTLTQELLHRLLHYDAERGVFIRKVKTAPCVEVGDVAGGMGDYGYPQLNVNGRIYKAHRLAWFYVHGVWPKEIDHIDRDRANFRIANLREATRGLNNRNAKVRSDNACGFKGVRWEGLVASRPWGACIQINEKQVFLGYYKTSEHAALAYDVVAREHFGDFSTLNFPDLNCAPPSPKHERDSRNTSGYIGVTRQNGKWMARFRGRGLNINLGSFRDPEEAARAYDKASLEHGGKKLNFKAGD